MRGSPELALGALQGAVRRGTVGLVVIGIMGAAHLAAARVPAVVLYETRCDLGDGSACRMAHLLRRDW